MTNKHVRSPSRSSCGHQKRSLLVLLVVILLTTQFYYSASDPLRKHDHKDSMAALAMVTKPASRLWRSYCKQLDDRPLLSRVATGVVGTVISDAMAQYSAAAMHRKKGAKVDMSEYDFGRTARLVVWSAFAGTPIAYKWFQFLDKTIMPLSPTIPKAVFIKTAMDQLLMAPIGTALFLAAIRTMEGKAHTLKETFQTKYAPSVMMNWMVWPAVHYVNFTYVPAQQRILYINIVGIMFGAVMSHFVMGKQSAQAEAGTEVEEDVVVADCAAVPVNTRRRKQE